MLLALQSTEQVSVTCTPGGYLFPGYTFLRGCVFGVLAPESTGSGVRTG